MTRRFEIPAKVGTMPASIWVTPAVYRKFTERAFKPGDRINFRKYEQGEVITGRVTKHEARLCIDKI